LFAIAQGGIKNDEFVGHLKLLKLKQKKFGHKKTRCGEQRVGMWFCFFIDAQKPPPVVGVAVVAKM
jgi:hypothetical protein